MYKLSTFLSKFKCKCKCKSINICNFFTTEKNKVKPNTSSVIGYI